MKKFFYALLVLLMLTGCESSTSPAKISESVRTDMQDEFNKQFPGLKFKVEDVDMTHKAGNEYQGIAKLDLQGHKYKLLVEITADKTGNLWKVDGRDMDGLQTAISRDVGAKILSGLFELSQQKK